MHLIKKFFSPNFFTTGLAMFAMFFGSGNLIFPVAIGQIAGEQNIFAILGLFITAVLLPFFTLCLMLLYDGDYNLFFQKIGVIPGKLIAFVALLLIGPFGVLPRCVAFSYSTFSIYSDSVGLFLYSTIACVIIFFLSAKKNDVVSIIGNFLTPILLISLAIIIYQGLLANQIPIAAKDLESNLSMFKQGFIEGYKTFDIFAALFFATAIIPAFQNALKDDQKGQHKYLVRMAFFSSVVGVILLFSIYACLSFVSANLRGALIDVPSDKLLGVISTLTMGKTAGLLANIIVSLACLTTAISLAVVSAEFIKKEVFQNKISYLNSLVVTIFIAWVVSLLGFGGIMRMILPILMIICPSVITLIVANGLNYFLGFPYIKTPVYLVFCLSLVFTVFL